MSLKNQSSQPLHLALYLSFTSKSQHSHLDLRTSMWPATTDAISDSSNCASLRTQVYLDPAIFVEHQSGEPFKCLIPSSLTAFHRLHFTTAPAVVRLMKRWINGIDVLYSICLGVYNKPCLGISVVRMSLWQ